MISVDAPSASAPAAPSIFDMFWDHGPREQVDYQLRALFSRQLERAALARAYSARIPAELLRDAVLSRAQIESLPVLAKRDLRALAPDDLLADPSQIFHMVRATGGTTGTPVPVFWTYGDWLALVHALQRFCTPLKEQLRPLRVWNGYNQAHISGPCFDDLVRALDGTPIPRHYGSSDRHALEEIARMRANALVITPQSGSGKGGSLEDLLSEDPRFLSRLGIRALIVSSTPLSPDLVEEVREQGVSMIVNFYGSTEAPPAAASCPVDPTMFHLSQGHVLVEVVGPDGRQVRSGERGSLVVSRIASAHVGGLRVAEATQLLRYATGDSVLYVDEPCACGRSSARIRDVERVADVDDKLRGGCERWE